VASDLIVESYAKAFDVNVEAYFKPGSNLSLLVCDECGFLSYDPMPSGDETFYEDLQRLPWYYQDNKPEYHFAKEHVNNQDRVLEVGCGKGVFRSFLANSVDYHGLEFNQAAIEKAKALGLNVSDQPIERHAEAHPNEYDVVCHFQVLEHVSDPKGFLMACVKALKPGGKLILAVPSEDSFLSITEGGWLNMPPHHVTRWKDSALHYAFEKQLALTVEAIWHEPVADYHRDWYRTTLANYAIQGFLGQRIGLTPETSIATRIARRIGAVESIRNWLISHAENHFPFEGRGHTVCAVGVKQNT